MRPVLLTALSLFLLSGCEAAQRMATDAMNAATTAATTRSNADWSTDATEYRNQVGTRIAYTCPANGSPNTVWGTGPYTDDSSVCTAGVHAGAITLARGGRVVIELTEGQSSYSGSRRNGIDTQGYGRWDGSFVVLR